MNRAWCIFLAVLTLRSGAFGENPAAKPAEPPAVLDDRLLPQPQPGSKRIPLTLAPSDPSVPSTPSAGESTTNKEARANQTWERLPLREKLQVLRLHRALREMDPQDRDFIRERIDRYLRMTPDERQQFKENRQRWQQLSPEEKERARQEYRRRREEFEKRWREKHPGEEPPPSPPRERSKGPPPPEEAPPPPAQDKAPNQNQEK